MVTLPSQSNTKQGVESASVSQTPPAPVSPSPAMPMMPPTNSFGVISSGRAKAIVPWSFESFPFTAPSTIVAVASYATPAPMPAVAPRASPAPSPPVAIPAPKTATFLVEASIDLCPFSLSPIA
ncbi:hypothetical protein E2C01_003837 [Portunus trituberculatus]|uniref:Uncharacterized protein n=1 Tax=Portunus trituberculatus TaxID=210409 RepID=A0A5B7CP06_PORTR|nr:hypothetical protein [Portunus trituberculatus]